MKRLFFFLSILTILEIVSVFGFNITQLYNFQKYPGNPIILPYGTGARAKAVFNPTAVIKDGRIYLLYREEDWTGVRRWNGTSKIGLAESEDGIHFHLNSTPVIVPTLSYETPGGCEDPRITKIKNTYYLTYTAYDGSTARLCEAFSTDLTHWTKVGPILPNTNWSKSGAILNEKINGKYVMYFGDSNIYIAYSTDLIHWKASPFPVLTPRSGMFDSVLVEAGPAPIMTDKGILLIYNGANYSHKYSTGAVIFSKNDPTQIVKRLDKPFLQPNKSWERYGQVPNVVFAEGLVILKSKWILYYGAADTYVCAAIMNY